MEEKTSNKTDINWILLLEKEMNEYNVEISSEENLDSDSENNEISIDKEKNKLTEKNPDYILGNRLEISKSK